MMIHNLVHFFIGGSTNDVLFVTFSKSIYKMVGLFRNGQGMMKYENILELFRILLLESTFYGYFGWKPG